MRVDQTDLEQQQHHQATDNFTDLICFKESSGSESFVFQSKALKTFLLLIGFNYAGNKQGYERTM